MTSSKTSKNFSGSLSDLMTASRGRRHRRWLWFQCHDVQPSLRVKFPSHRMGLNIGLACRGEDPAVSVQPTAYATFVIAVVSSFLGTGSKVLNFHDLPGANPAEC